MTTYGIKSIVVLAEGQVKEGGMTWLKSLEGWAPMLKKPLDNETWPRQLDGTSNRETQQDRGHRPYLGGKTKRFVFWGCNGILGMMCELVTHGGMIEDEEG